MDYDCLACYEGFYVKDGRCVEVCGDGKNYGKVGCDDGNTVNGDG